MLWGAQAVQSNRICSEIEESETTFAWASQKLMLYRKIKKWKNKK